MERKELENEINQMLRQKLDWSGETTGKLQALHEILLPVFGDRIRAKGE